MTVTRYSAGWITLCEEGREQDAAGNSRRAERLTD
jgi:hypothetical protein